MNLESVLKSLDDQGQEKQASAIPNATPEDALQGALASVLEKVASGNEQPVANSANSPVDDLMKLAGQMADAEKEAEVALAGSLGRAFADAAIGQWSSYDSQTKVASAHLGNSEDELIKAAEEGYQIALADMDALEKQAEADPGMVQQQAASQGYADAQEAYMHEKTAAEHEYVQGQQDALEEIRTVAANEFYKGAQEVQTLIAIANQQG